MRPRRARSGPCTRWRSTMSAPRCGTPRPRSTGPRGTVRAGAKGTRAAAGLPAARVPAAAAALLDPGRYGTGVGPGQAAQPSGGPGQRLVRFALAGALEDAGDLGQQV